MRCETIRRSYAPRGLATVGGQIHPSGTLLICNGRVIVGTGDPSPQAGVRVSGDSIEEIAAQLIAATQARAWWIDRFRGFDAV
jgi:hypothetical protein